MIGSNEIFGQQTCITLNGEANPTAEGRMSVGTLGMIYIFILAIFTGVEVISRVPTVLHTPLMSGANAIHGIVLIGGVILLGTAGGATVLCVRVGFYRRDSRHAQRCRRLRRDRPDAGDVQSQAAAASEAGQMNPLAVPEASFLIASLLFIFGLKRLSSPRTARSGNMIAAVGMALALVGTFLIPHMGHFGLIVIAIAIGTVPGWLLAKRVKMTAMPQMVSLFNGMGGACALFISLGEWLGHPAGGRDWGLALPTLLGIVFGSVSFTGSLVAFGKLQGLITEKPLRWPMQKAGNALLLLVILASVRGCVVESI